MAIRWRRDAPYTGLQRAAGHRRLFRLQDSETDRTYMVVDYRSETADKPAGWAYIIYYPAHVGNKISTGRWNDETTARNFAKAWWAKNREQHLKEWNK